MPSFDVFVSYSRADQDMVERLGRALQARGLTVFVDRWYLVAGQSWPETWNSASATAAPSPSAERS